MQQQQQNASPEVQDTDAVINNSDVEMLNQPISYFYGSVMKTNAQILYP